MKTLTKKTYILLLLNAIFTLNLFAQSSYNSLEFIENKGQWNNKVKFKGDLGNGAFFLRKTGFTVLQHNKEDLVKVAAYGHGQHNPPTPVQGGTQLNSLIQPDGIKDNMPTGILRSHAYYMDFAGANENVEIIPEKPQVTYNNYFLGDDARQWAGNCRIYQVITYKNIYPGIDVRYYTENARLKYEFLVHPGANPDQIAMQFEGADKLSIRNNELIIQTSVGEVKELAPYTYQFIGHERRKIDCRYQVKGNVVRFNIKNYSRQQTLIIDPTLVFASFTGSIADNWGYTATYGNDGTFFGGGVVFDNGFPTSPGAFQTGYGGGGVNQQAFWNMGIMRFSADGAQRIYATYIGGNNRDQPHSLFADAQGNLVIAGRTSSTNYPVTATFGTSRGWDIVVTKLNATGTALIGSVKICGTGDDGFNTGDSHNGTPIHLLNNYGDDARSEVILDAAANIYVASCTQSTDFYTTPNAVQTTLSGSQDAVLIKLNPNCNSVLYSSYLGGSAYDAGFVLALNPADGDIYMAGGTTSSDFPGNKTGTIQPVYNGGRSDGFVAVFSNDGSVLRKSTYIGTSGTDVVFGIQFDKNAFPYVMGITSGAWPVVNATYSVPNSKQFISKLQKDLSNWVYSTVFGNGSATPNISPVAFLVDRCENVYVSGWGRDVSGRQYNLSSIRDMPVTPDAIKSTAPDDKDLYFIVIKKNATQLLYGTFYGQNGEFGEHVDGGTSRFDQNGVIYQAICANCLSPNNPKPQWPVTPGAWCCGTGVTPATGGSECNLAALKIAFQFAGVAASVKAFINSVFDTSGCVPLDVIFRDSIRNAQSYEWNFGDGSPDEFTTSYETNHTYNTVGSFRVRLIAVDSNSCNIRDTSYVTIRVRNDEALLDFNITKLPPCESLSYQFDNLSVAPTGKPFTNQSFIWDFGDGTRITTGAASQTHTYLTPGTYTVKLILPDTNYCNAPDSVVRQLRVSPLVKAQFEIPTEACVPFNAVFNNISLAGETFIWDFGDGTTSNAINPTHLYNTPGTYIVRLQAFDPNTCNLQDDTTVTITVYGTPQSVFTFTPVVPEENVPNTFFNSSSADAVRFKWLFGDGDSLITTSRVAIEHQYNKTGTYNACLIAFNQFGCPDTTCTPVTVVVVPKIDVPNAFTPLGPATVNSIGVRGFAIGKMKFTIYNRWGQKVFETTNKNQGWDGRFKGTVQPMDVYGYTLEVEFTDGTRTTKKGDITLIR